MPAGDYRLDRIDVFSGKSTKSESIKSPGALTINSPDFRREVALRIRKSARTCFFGVGRWLADGYSPFALRIIIAITGASGVIYTQRLLDCIDATQHEVHLVLSNYAHQVIKDELPGGLRVPPGVPSHGLKSMNVPFVSGSNPFDAMVVIPCTMGTMGRIAHGVSEDVLTRAADVMLKEKRKLILVPREMPLSLIHVKNMELLLMAGATLLPANPFFYTNPTTIEQVVDTVVARVLDHLGLPQKLIARWQEEGE
jgi:4-hydroxy-3-polyprenylbenzoate decarboxylase